MKIRLNFQPEWEGLMKAKLSPQTPIANDMVQDYDPQPYRRDERLDYCFVGAKFSKTHLAELRCVSDDESYKVVFILLELDDPKHREVYRKEITKFGPQKFSLKSSSLTKHKLEIKQGVRINVELGVYERVEPKASRSG